MGFPRLVLLTTTFGICQFAWTQSPTYGLGRTPSGEEIRAWDISISPTGKELPSGQGTAKEGAALYVRKGCAGCHGATGSSGGHAPTLIRRKEPQTTSSGPCLAPCVNDANAMAVHSPFATTIWDYINRGMPLGKEGTLSPNEVYALTAFLLYKNDVIQEDEVMDAQSLPKVKMPNRDGFALPPLVEAWDAKASGLPVVPYTSGTGAQRSPAHRDGKRPRLPIRRNLDQDRRRPGFSLAPLVARDAFPDQGKNFPRPISRQTATGACVRELGVHTLEKKHFALVDREHSIAGRNHSRHR